jgi:hypothetical protein
MDTANKMKIDTKALMYRLYEGGGFGNKLVTWPNVKEFIRSKSTCSITLRYKGQHGGGWCAYNVPSNEVKQRAAQWVSEGANESLITVNESAPDECLRIQGEIIQDDALGYSLFYSTEKGKMRDVLKKGKSILGPSAKLILKDYFSPSSYEDLQVLFDEYSNAAVEFSTYSINLGGCPGRNTIIWEVRNY